MFITHFLIANIIISIYCVCIMTIRKIFDDKISPKGNYLLFIPFVLLTMLALLPRISVLPDFYHIPRTDNVLLYSAYTPMVTGNTSDYYLSVSRHSVLLIIWLAGMIVTIFAAITGYIFAAAEVKNAHAYKSKAFNKCCEELGVDAELYITDRQVSPFSFGIIHKCVIIPRELLYFHERELKCIFLHELTHHRHRDIFVNYLICVLVCVYWFNPVIIYAFKQIRLDMEIYCDYCVVKHLKGYGDYAETIIHFIESKNMPAVVNNISGSKKDIKIRLSKIKYYGSFIPQKLGRIITFIVLIAAVLSVLVMNVFGYSIDDSCNKKIDKIEYIDLSSYFGEYEGCFAAYSVSSDNYIMYNEEMCRKRVSPNSTYKIAIALNSLENGVISQNDNAMQWDGTDYPFAQWNRNQSLETAMRYSVNWYFQNIDGRISLSRLKDFLNKTGYGNKSSGFDRKNYWLERDLAISPIEQVDFLKGVYFNKFGFEQDNINTVLNSIKVNDSLYGKTGTGQINGKTQNGWYIGIYKNTVDTYIFAVRIAKEDKADGEAAAKIAGEILNYYN